MRKQSLSAVRPVLKPGHLNSCRSLARGELAAHGEISRRGFSPAIGQAKSFRSSVPAPTTQSALLTQRRAKPSFPSGGPATIRGTRHSQNRWYSISVSQPEIDRLSSTLDVVLAQAADGKAPISEVANILDALKDSMKRMSIAEKRREVTRLEIGSRVLRWIQNVDFVYLPGKVHAGSFIWHIVAADLREDLYKWMFSQRLTRARGPTSDEDTVSIVDRCTVYTCYFTSLIEYELKLSRDGTANQALLCFAGAVDILNPAKSGTSRGKCKGLIIWGLVPLDRSLQTDNNIPSDPCLYDRHLAAKRLLFGSGRSGLEKLLLYHPARPNPLPWFARMESLSQGRTAWRPKNDKSWNSVFADSIRAACLLRIIGRFSEASWLENWVSKRGGKAWAAREKIVEATMRDRKVQNLIAELKTSQNGKQPSYDVHSDTLSVIREARGMPGDRRRGHVG